MKSLPTLFLSMALIGCSIAPSVVHASAYNPGSAGVELRVSMGEDGGVTVSGARVRSVGDAEIIAETLWGAGKLTWTIQTNERTPITRRNGARVVLTDVTAGDYISFVGTIQTNMPPFTVSADSVRDWSIGANHTSLSGTIAEISTETNTLTLTTADGEEVTVSLSDETSYAQSGARSLADFSVGDTVTAFGTQTGNTITAKKVNLVERAVARASGRSVMATGLGSWVDVLLPRFFEGRLN